MKDSFSFFFVSAVVICISCLFFLNEILFLFNGFSLAELQVYTTEKSHLLRSIRPYKLVAVLLCEVLAIISTVWSYRIYQTANPYRYGIAVILSVVLTVIYAFLIWAYFFMPNGMCC